MNSTIHCEFVCECGRKQKRIDLSQVRRHIAFYAENKAVRDRITVFTMACAV